MFGPESIAGNRTKMPQANKNIKKIQAIYRELYGKDISIKKAVELLATLFFLMEI
jgi:hypothetical protein